MSGSIPTPNPGSLNMIEKKNNIGSQTGHTKKILLKKFVHPE